MTNQSFRSEKLSSGTKVAMQDNIHSIHIHKGNELILGDFANPCLDNASVCSSFSISFLVYISGSVELSENVYVLDSNSSLSRKGPYHVEFYVTRSSPARLEGHAFVVGGNSSKLLEREITFPATDSWVHVAIVYSSPGSLVLYVNSVVVTPSDPVIPTDWQGTNSPVQVSLGSEENSRDIFVSYLQIIKGTLSPSEVAQVEKESRAQGNLNLWLTKHFWPYF